VNRIVKGEFSGQSAGQSQLVSVKDPGGVGPEDIRSQMDRLLASPSFRNSKRHTQFLHFLIEKYLTGVRSEIKERTIGIEVFERKPDYDLTIDPIVRGAAVELRKRIAQYYADPVHVGELRVELPVGAYVPTFHWPDQANKRAGERDQSQLELLTATKEQDPGSGGATQVAPARTGKIALSLRRILAVFALVALLGVLLFVLQRRATSDERALAAFWDPLFEGGDQIVICAGDLNGVMHVQPVPNDTWTHMTATENHLDPNIGAALLRLGTIMGSKNKRPVLKLADLTPLSDLREQPVVFLGGFNNPWTQRILAGLRFQMKSQVAAAGTYGMIIDQKNPQQTSWSVDLSAAMKSITRDYSLVTRLRDPLTGQPVVLLSGIGSYGNSAASEFVTKPAYFAQFSRTAPRGWEERTIQIVLETTVVDGKVSVPRVVAEQAN
jgi:hypothetical protein